MNILKKAQVALASAILTPIFFASQVFAAGSSLDILKSGLLGVGMGAISAGMSGGKPGKGALIGAGTHVIGGALLDMLSGSSTSPTSSNSYYYAPTPTHFTSVSNPASTSSAAKKHIFRKFDTSGNIISEEEVWL